MNIICLSNQTWDYPLWTNKRHVMHRLAKRGHKVLFVDPPLRLRKIVKQIVQGRWSLRRIITQTYQPQENVTVYTPLTVVAPSENPNMVAINVLEMDKILKIIPPDAVLWVYNPTMIKYVERIPHKILVYDCVDEYSAMANYKKLGLSEKVADWEKEIASRADIVFATTETLKEKLKQYNDNTHFVSNAGDYERFSPVGRGKVEVAKDLEEIPSPRIGFVGAIDEYKVNLELIERCAKAYPEYSFVLVGPSGVADSQPNIKNLKTLPNVYFLGSRPYEQKASYLAGFDVEITPYNLNDYTVKGCLPVKFLDTLAAGIPAVVTNLPSFKPYRYVAYIAQNNEEFVKMIATAMEEDSEEKKEERMEIAKENSWENKVDKMFQLVSTL